MPQSVYLENTFISFLTAWTSRNLLRAVHQQMTHDWWNEHRLKYDLRISELVLLEAAAGDPNAAKDRLSILNPIPLLEITNDAREVAEALIETKAVPGTEPRDALHIGICAVHEIDYLLTWNFKHLVNAHLTRKIETTIERLGYRPPLICTPESLLE